MPVNSQHPEFSKMVLKWKRCRDAYDGSDAIKAAGEAYLPRLTKQSDEDYKAYLARALFYGATERTVQGLTGAAVSKPFIYKLAPGLKYLEENSTSSQMSAEEVTKWAVNELLIAGRIGVLVERPATGDGNTYFVPYRAEQIINWDEADGKLIRVILAERYYEVKADDPYCLTEKDRWRELVMENGAYVQKVHKKKLIGEGFDTEVIAPSRRGNPLDFIPFIMGGPDGISYTCVKPPLLALVDVNLSHYCNSADLEHGRHYTGLPTPWVAGSKVDGDLRIGSSSAWVFDDPTTKVGFLEFTGGGLSSLERAQDQKERQMAVLGARLLEGQRPGVEAAETVRMRQMGDVFTLASINGAAADMLKLALSYAEKWDGGKGDASDVTPNLDFVDSSLSAQEITALVSAWTAGAISLETFLWNLKKGERMGKDIEEEMKDIEDEKAKSPASLPVLTPEEREAAGLPPEDLNAPPAPGFLKQQSKMKAIASGA